MADTCINISDCSTLLQCLKVGVCERSQQVIAPPSGPPKTDSRCVYLAVGLCNKCGRVHDGRPNPETAFGVPVESGGKKE